jgi:spore maturation protein CgeB
MKILVIGKFYSEGFALHIAETLEGMGHTISRFEPGAQTGRYSTHLGHRIEQIRGVIHASTDGIPRVRRRRMRALWDVAADAAPDAVIVSHDFLWPEEVARLKSIVKGPVSMWCPDHLGNFGRAYFMNAPYDGLFFKDPFIVHTAKDVLRSPVYYLPECFNPQRHVSPPPTGAALDALECDITTAGNQHSWRVAFFSQLSAYRVRVWGNPAPLWMPTDDMQAMHQGRGVYNEEKAQAFQAAKIVLNNLHYGEVWGVNVRCFEAAGVGAFQMVDWRPGLSQLFDDGRELISFRGMRDLKSKIDHWLPRKDERTHIAEAGRRRAHSDHTYAMRLQLLLDTLQGRKQGFPMPRIDVIVGGEQTCTS